MRHVFTLGALLVTTATPAMTQAPADIATLSDEFEGDALSPDWTIFHARYGWPDKIKTIDIGRTTRGALHLQPYDSAWVRDLNAPFLFKTLQGDFDVRARVRVRGLDGPVPGGTWSLGGLMARAPNGLDASKWHARAENWNFITTGVGHEAGKVMTETKATYNSTSNLKLRPWDSGWTELRLVRAGMAMFALARSGPDQPWQVRDRWYRMEGPPAMQVGLIAYTSSPDVAEGPDDPDRVNREVDKQARVDMALEVDWIRFARPQAEPVRDWYAQVNGTNRLTDPNLPESELLRILGA